MDCILLDLSKAFDKVPNNRLLTKLHHYGIRGHTHDWISSFLVGRAQRVVLDGQSSSTTTVSSGVPQGTVLGPLLLLIFINDLPSSTTRLFADDCLMYRRIKTPEDQAILQRDFNKLQEWEDRWLMHFNPDKCDVLRVTNRKPPELADYIIHSQVLNTVDSAKYLGLTIHKSLSWDTHIDKITKKANSTLAFSAGTSGDAQLPSRHSATPPWCDQHVPSNTPPACGAQLRRKPSTNLRRISVGQLDSPLEITSAQAA